MKVGDKGVLVFRGARLGDYDLLAAEFVGNAYAPREHDTFYYRALEAKGAIKVGNIIERRPLYQWEMLQPTRESAEQIAKERRVADLKSEEARLLGIQRQIAIETAEGGANHDA